MIQKGIELRMLFLLLFVLLSACASSISVVHPQSGLVIHCQGIGQTQVERCASRYETLGFIKAENLDEQQKANLVIKEMRVERVGPEIKVETGNRSRPSFLCRDAIAGHDSLGMMVHC